MNGSEKKKTLKDRVDDSQFGPFLAAVGSVFAGGTAPVARVGHTEPFQPRR